MWPFRRTARAARPRFHSAEELFTATTALIARLEAQGSPAAAELRDGMACLNGLTDGWAMFLEAIKRAQALVPRDLPTEDQVVLDALRREVHRIVYRR